MRKIIRQQDIFADNLWRRHSNYSSGTTYPEIPYDHRDPVKLGKAPSIEEILETQVDAHFVELMNNRMLMGFFRYGAKASQKGKYNYVMGAIARLQRYFDTRNTEALVDAANLLRMEFSSPSIPGAHFSAEDDQFHSKPQ